ncbi:MAG: hypothetical protein IJ200_09310 [Prevotella sp.]|nr:hypothetical protein [Prevotella sp.]
MAQLPAAFTEYTRRLMGEERFSSYLRSFDEEPPVSIRLNPRKTGDKQWTARDGEPVPWCRNGYYLPRRPNFTMDPLLHAGCYYVQEAASMFLDEVLRQDFVNGQWIMDNGQGPTGNGQWTMDNGQWLDLCAAPGGKSTLLRAALPDGCTLYSNEPVRQRASILAENIAKWGGQNHVVTNCYPRDYRKAKMRFDAILCDVPCSGEGMFRKDPATIREWSPQQVEKCWQLQRDIVDDAWACLNDGGLLIYSTCTFNTKENEENIRYFLEQYDARLLPVATRPKWNITGSLLEGFDQPVYRFIPGITRSEGLFLCVLQKGGRLPHEDGKAHKADKANGVKPYRPYEAYESYKPMASPTPQAELTYQQAMAYLRHEALQLPADTPRGIVEVTFMGQPLGPVKNIGTRANNLYPKEWKVKTTHIAPVYDPVLSPIT